MQFLIETIQNERRWTAVLVGTLLLGSLWIWWSAVPPNALDQSRTASPKEGFAAPDFTLDSLAGEAVSLGDLRGQVVVINLWASWCLPCRAEMPAINEVYQRRKGDGLVVLGVNSTYQDDEEAAVAFVQELALSFPILFDRDGAVSRRYLLQALPTTFFVDRRGVIREVVPGGNLTESIIESKIASLLAEEG